MGFTLGTSYSGDTYIGNAAGAWTTFTASTSPTTNKYYVRSAFAASNPGNNATAAVNDHTRPWASVSSAVCPGNPSGLTGALKAMRIAQSASGTATEGLPNWLLIAEGDYFIDDYFDVDVWDNFTLSGKSLDERFIITSYDPANPTGTPHPAVGAQPKFFVPNQNTGSLAACQALSVQGTGINGLSPGQYCAMIGIELYSYQRDPTNVSTFSATVSGSTFTASGVTGFICMGAVVKGTSVPANTRIISGPLTGGAGTYTCNNSLTGSTPNAADAYAVANGASTLEPTGIGMLSYYVNGFAVEDCKISTFGTNFDIINRANDNINTPGTQFNNIALRRNVIVDAYNPVGNSQGVHMWGVYQPIIEENVFDHNGWNPAAGINANDKNRNLYLSAYGWAQGGPVTNVIYKGNISVRSSTAGCQFRGENTIAYDCFWGRNYAGFEVGHQEMDILGWGGNPTVTNMDIRRHVITESEDRPPDSTITAGGFGIILDNMKGSGVVLRDIIIAHGTSTSVNAMAFGMNSPYTIWTYTNSGTGTSSGFTLNISASTYIDHWMAGWQYPIVTFSGTGSGTTLTVTAPTGPVIIGSVITGGGIVGRVTITAQQADGNQARGTGNYTTSASVSGVSGTITCVPPKGSSLSGTGIPANTQFTGGPEYGYSGAFTTDNVTTCSSDTVTGTMDILATAGVHGITLDSSIIVFDWHSGDFNASDGHGAANTIAYRSDLAGANIYGLPDPYRTMASFCSDVLGGSASSDDLIARWRTQSKKTWDYNLTANKIDNYFFEGFGFDAPTSDWFTLRKTVHLHST